MKLDTQGRKGVTYFIGTEVERTAMFGEKTLFVVGTPPADEIAKIATQHRIKHLYFGTSQSFTPSDPADWQKWDVMLTELLLDKWVCTLDFGVEYAPTLLEYGWNEFSNFIPMISVKLPYINQFNYNATLKLDDVTWGHSNPGVWCHSLHELQQRAVYTDWREYVGDTVINKE